MNPLEEFASQLPPGNFWVNRAFFTRLLAAMQADRARLMPTSGNEIASPDGRWFDVQPGAAEAGAEPWQPLAGKTDPTKVRIAPFSRLSKFDPYDITASFTVDHIEDEFSLAAGDSLYLQLGYDTDTGMLSTVGVAAGVWDGYPQAFKTSGAGTLASPAVIETSFFRLAVASTSTTEPPGLTLGGVRIVRCVYTPLALQPVYMAGYVFTYPVPWVR